MSEDTEAAERARSLPDPAGAAASSPTVPENNDSRVEIRLWGLTRGPDRTEARMCTKFGRRDFRVYVNGELLWSRNYVAADRQGFDDDARARYRELIAAGWTDLAD